MNASDVEWISQKLCTDIEDYELIVEKQKTSWNCEQRKSSWKWIISYHGTIVASGSVNNEEEAKLIALKNVPLLKDKH